ncbi:MAG TPA: biotin/lipoyl-containing protein [Candidatus Acidoferrales bacterium]|nr:biotin/lipoyl-containing protein [Candidatus Acidoferrales bacterium]
MASLNTAPDTWEAALERIRAAASACVEGDLSRLRIDEPAFTLEVRRTRRPAPVVGPAGAQLHLPETIEAPMGEPAHTNGVAHEPAPTLIKADLVGIVRLSKPLVSEGSSVSEDRELAYVESLGTHNPIRATAPGTIRAVFVTDGQPVDFGLPLFSIVYE